MNTSSKLYGVQVIDSTNKSFTAARVRLSILYTVVFGVLVLLLSAALYYLFAADIHEDMSSVFPEKSEQVRIINQHKGKLLRILLAIDGGILLFIAGAGYILAGNTLKPIHQNYEAQKNFIADASHELRTPIAVLKADMEVNLRDKKFSRTFKSVFRSYLEEVNHMKRIVEDLLTLFRFDSNQVVLDRKYIDFVKLITKYTASMRSYAKRKGITIRFIAGARSFITGDAMMLQQAYRNILKNAIEYSSQGGVVSIRMSTQGKFISLEVNNTGIGIPKEMVDQIFERYNRTNDSRKQRAEGMGLGLSISKHIIEKHAGTITLLSSQEEGTTFRIVLPLAQDETAG